MAIKMAANWAELREERYNGVQNVEILRKQGSHSTLVRRRAERMAKLLERGFVLKEQDHSAKTGCSLLVFKKGARAVELRLEWAGVEPFQFSLPNEDGTFREVAEAEYTAYAAGLMPNVPQNPVNTPKNGPTANTPPSQAAPSTHFAVCSEWDSIQPNLLKLRSSSGATYVTDGTVCSCPAGENGKLCWHLPYHGFQAGRRAAALREEAKQSSAVRAGIKDGTYTVVFENTNGGYRTLKVQTMADGALKGKTLLKFLSGPDNSTDFTGFAFYDPATGDFRLWKKHQAGHLFQETDIALRAIAHDPFAAGEAYALKSGKCCKCAKKLTVPTSLHRGMGKDCWVKYGA